jgi:hypothetical protein
MKKPFQTVGWEVGREKVKYFTKCKIKAPTCQAGLLLSERGFNILVLRVSGCIVSDTRPKQGRLGECSPITRRDSDPIIIYKTQFNSKEL